MDGFELDDIFPGLNDEALGLLNIEPDWSADIFNDLTAEDLEDALLTDITSKQTAKTECIDMDIFSNDLVVGDEVEVNNSFEQTIIHLPNSVKDEPLVESEEFTQTASTDDSPETCHLTPEVESNCPTPSNSDSSDSPPHLHLVSKTSLKRSKFEDMVLEESPSDMKRVCAFSPPIVPCEPSPSALNRVHHVLQKGQTLILQTEKPCNRSPQNTASQARIKALNTHQGPNQSVYRSENNDFIRIKPLPTHQRSSGVYSGTGSGSQTSSDTDGGTESPADSTEKHGSFSVFNTRNGVSLSSTSTIRLTPASNNVYTSVGRFNSGASYVGRHSDDSGYGVEFTNDYSGGYTTNNSSTPYRQHPVFQNSSGILVLTDEEKRTLLAEGYSIPTRLPLSKQDERNLKKIRRKIKNKISAQESRRKKKEYVEGLEKRVEAYAQENAKLKTELDRLGEQHRIMLSQLRQLRHMVDSKTPAGGATITTTSNTATSNSPTASKKNSGSNTTNGSIQGSGTNSGSSSAFLMVFLACFLALFAGQVEYTTTAGSGVASYSSAAVASSKRHIVGDFSTFGSLHQIGYTWSGRTSKMGPRLDGDSARGPNVSYMKDLPAGPASIYRMHEWARASVNGRVAPVSQGQERTSIAKPVSRSRILGSTRDFEECEPMTWWEYFFGQSGSECNEETTNANELFFEAPKLDPMSIESASSAKSTTTTTATNDTISTAPTTNCTAVQSILTEQLSLVQSNFALVLANQVLISA